MAEQITKERLNNNEFRELIPHLPLADLLRIEYRTDKWYKLITVSDAAKKLYGCNLCSITNSNGKNLTAHMEGKKHKVAIQDVKQLYHPEYTYSKQDWKLAVGVAKSPQAPVKPTAQKAKGTETTAAVTKPGTTTEAETVTNKASTKTSVTPAKPVAKPATAVSTPSAEKPTSVAKTPSPAIKNPASAKNTAMPLKTAGAALKNPTNAVKAAAKPATPKAPPATVVKKAPNTPAKPPIKTKTAMVKDPSTPSGVKPLQKNTAAKNTNADTPTKAIPVVKTSESAANKSTPGVPVKPAVDKSTPGIRTETAAGGSTPVAPAKDPSASNSSVGETQKNTLTKTSNDKINEQTTSESKDQKKSSEVTIKKELGTVVPTTKSGPNANDRSWNPKVSVKNLNVAKITKITESHSSQSENKDIPSTSKDIMDKINLKKVSNAMKTGNTQTGAATPQKKVSEDTTALKANSVEEKSDNEKNSESVDNSDETATKDQANTTNSVEKSTKVNKSDANKQQNSATKIREQQNEFSDDVQFGDIVDSSQVNLVKNPFALKQDAAKNRVAKITCVSVDKLRASATENINASEKSIDEEVIVIDDDVPSAEEQNAMPPMQKIPIIERHAASKPQRQRVRPTATEPVTNAKPTVAENINKRTSGADPVVESGNFPKKQKIVRNPAAFVVETASNKEKPVVESTDSEKPKYQKDRVIIPTIHKSKVDTSSKSTNQVDFSTKTFSSRPKDDDVHGLIGVEYVVKIMKTRDDISPRYECSLCELILDGPSMQNHLVAFNHRLKFCEKHFPTAVRQYRSYISKVPTHETYKVLTPILAKLAVAIEQHHGRDLPYEVLEHDYNINRHEILSKVFSCRHASEQQGPAFTHVLDTKEVDLIIAQKDNFKPQTCPSGQIFHLRPGMYRRERRRQREEMPERHGTTSSRPHPYLAPSQSRPHGRSDLGPMVNRDNPGFVPPVDDETHKKMVADFLRGTGGSRRHDSRDRERRSRRSRSRDRVRRRSRSRSNQRQHRASRKSISPLREGDIWQAYRHLVDQKVNDLNEVFKLYRNDPETHPMYNDEWQKFWKRRKDELIAAGLDHRSYNYQPEWVRFFKVRIEELYSQALENIKVQSRERLCLPMTNNHLADPKYHVHIQGTYPGTPLVEPYNEINDKHSSSMEDTTFKVKPKKNPDVIGVLRLLTALEEHLGILGPKVIDLMSKALLIEKSIPEEINDVILTVENCTLLQTAMEKLKGVLFAGLLEGTKERAFKKVIADTELLLSFAEEERKRKPAKTVQPPNYGIPGRSAYVPTAPAPVPVPAPIPPQAPLQSLSQSQPPSRGLEGNVTAGSSVASVNKKELAARLAATLTAQGKTDFNPDQLEQLIAVYTMIEKKKREAASGTSTSATSDADSFQQDSSLANRKTLSDTLVDFMNPSNPNFSSTSTSAANIQDDFSAKQSYTAATINRYLDMMRRTGGNMPNSGIGNSVNEIWQNLQNIQRGLGIANTNANQSMTSLQSSSGRRGLDYSSSSSFNNSGQFGINSVASKDSYSMSSNSQSFRNYNTSAGLRGNVSQPGMSSHQQQNPYLANTMPQAPYTASGNTFANTNNNSRAINKNVNINSNQPSQQNRPAQSLQGKNNTNLGPNRAAETAPSFGANKRKNQIGGGSGGGSNVSSVGRMQNQNWRRN